MDTGSFPSRVSLSAQFVGTAWQGTFTYEGSRCELGEIQSVLVRRPTHYHVQEEVPDLDPFLRRGRTWRLPHRLFIHDGTHVLESGMSTGSIIKAF